MKYFTTILISILLTSPVYSQESRDKAEEQFSRAAGLYSAGSYNEALEIWLALYNSGYRSAQLSYNIGNSYFKLNNIPGSILFYERALLLKPADEDINYNLQIAMTMVVDKLAEIPDLFFVTWFRFVSLSLSSNTWAAASLVSFILFLLLLSVYLFSKRYKLKVAGFWLSVILLTVSITCISLSFGNRRMVLNNKNAIIFCPVASGKSSPDSSGTDLFVIHEGTKVKIEDEVGEWLEIRLSDGNKGWIPSNCLERL